MSLKYEELTKLIISAAIEVHKYLGPGLLEIAYQTCLSAELDALGLNYQRELAVPLRYKDKKLDCGFRIDFLVEDTVILELKSIETILPVHEAQILSYLRFSNKQIGLILNFNEPVLKKGIRRFALNTKDNPSSLYRECFKNREMARRCPKFERGEAATEAVPS